MGRFKTEDGRGDYKYFEFTGNGTESDPFVIGTTSSSGTTSDAATATNQQTQITRLTEIRDKTPIEGTDITGVIMPAGGNGIRGWLSSLYSKIAGLTISPRGEIYTSFMDFASNPNNINNADVASTSTVGANNQTIISGNPTNNSTVSVAITGESSFAIQINGTFSGTLQFERSLDNGNTWTSVGAFAAGTPQIVQQAALPGNFHGNASSATNLRVRAIAWASGQASVRILAGAGTGTITIGNPLRIFDSTSGAFFTIKSAFAAAKAEDTALVVAPKDAANNFYESIGTSAGGNIRSGATFLYSLDCTNLNSSTRYLQLLNSQSTPSAGATPRRSYPVYGNSGFLVLDTSTFGLSGLAFGGGLSFGFSTTPLTYTPGVASDCILNVRYAT